MEKRLTRKFKPLNATAIKALCKETPETKLTQTELKKFTAVDLWAIHKSRKAVALRF